MQKLTAITTFLVNLDLVSAESLDTWAENIRLEGSVRDEGNGLTLLEVHYDALISFESFNHKALDPALIFAHVVTWLINHDVGRDEFFDSPLSLPTDVTVLDDSLADLEITVPFVEKVQAVIDPAGPVLLNGQNYRIETVLIDYAETGEVKTDDT